MQSFCEPSESANDYAIIARFGRVQSDAAACQAQLVVWRILRGRARPGTHFGQHTRGPIWRDKGMRARHGEWPVERQRNIGGEPAASRRDCSYFTLHLPSGRMNAGRQLARVEFHLGETFARLFFFSFSLPAARLPTL